MTDCGHERFDTDCNQCWTRVTFHGCAFLGADSIHAPKHGAPRDLTRGAFKRPRKGR